MTKKITNESAHQTMLYTDGSADPTSGIGYGACLIITDPTVDPVVLKQTVQCKRFENTSSTRLELETLIWALQDIQPGRIKVYSDSQNIIELPGRKARLERSQYCSASGKPLNNAELYRQFFKTIQQYDCTFIKVKGHRRSREKSLTDQLFTLVDRASRQALRQERSET